MLESTIVANHCRLSSAIPFDLKCSLDRATNTPVTFAAQSRSRTAPRPPVPPPCQKKPPLRRRGARECRCCCRAVHAATRTHTTKGSCCCAITMRRMYCARAVGADEFHFLRETIYFGRSLTRLSTCQQFVWFLVHYRPTTDPQSRHTFMKVHCPLLRSLSAICKIFLQKVLCRLTTPS